jgi:AbrB family looped-hinge helix DNA binding protein
MNKANAQLENGVMPLVRLLRGGQVTLPAEARKALKLKEGDYLDFEMTDRGMLLKPAAVPERARAWDDLSAILDRVKWVGPGPEPSEDEVMDTVVDEIHAMRAEHDQGRSR